MSSAGRARFEYYKKEIEESRVAIQLLRDEAGNFKVMCGEAVGLLHSELFVCPGIYAKCVEQEGSMMSPHEFCKRKDWKTSIRIGSHTLRWLMEFGLIDFHNHRSTCSRYCVNQEKKYTYCEYIKNASRKLPNLYYYPGPTENVVIPVQQFYPPNWVITRQPILRQVGRPIVLKRSQPRVETKEDSRKKEVGCEKGEKRQEEAISGENKVSIIVEDEQRQKTLLSRKTRRPVSPSEERQKSSKNLKL